MRTAARRALAGTAVAALAAAGLTALPAVAAHAACSDVELIAARGTYEPGTLGFVVGDPLHSALRTRLTAR